jgi:hypothetical protein
VAVVPAVSVPLSLTFDVRVPVSVGVIIPVLPLVATVAVAERSNVRVAVGNLLPLRVRVTRGDSVSVRVRLAVSPHPGVSVTRRVKVALISSVWEA